MSNKRWRPILGRHRLFVRPAGRGTGGNGGGLVRIVAGTLTLNGSILADGGSSTFGGGSGGGIRIDAGRLGGSGTISAKGGASTNNGAAAAALRSTPTAWSWRRRKSVQRAATAQR